MNARMKKLLDSDEEIEAVQKLIDAKEKEKRARDLRFLTMRHLLKVTFMVH